jgi:hypothetical protein
VVLTAERPCPLPVLGALGRRLLPLVLLSGIIRLGSSALPLFLTSPKELEATGVGYEI